MQCIHENINENGYVRDTGKTITEKNSGPEGKEQCPKC